MAAMTMTDRSRKPSVGKALVLLMCLALPVSGFSQNAVDRLDFAESLMAEKHDRQGVPPGRVGAVV